MGRLIDADAYAAEMRKRQENCRAWKDSLDRGSETYARAEQSFITFVEAALTLKNQPTVDAIPVEWLENRLNTLCFEVMGAGALYGDRIGELAKSINEVMKLWQKEQEAR